MAINKPYKEVPGTIIFDADMARLGFHLNQFCMSLMKAPNRKKFKAGEKVYLDEWPMSEAQKEAVIARAASTMTGMTQDEYAQMMLSGGRAPDSSNTLKKGS